MKEDEVYERNNECKDSSEDGERLILTPILILIIIVVVILY